MTAKLVAYMRGYYEVFNLENKNERKRTSKYVNKKKKEKEIDPLSTVTFIIWESPP